MPYELKGEGVFLPLLYPLPLPDELLQLRDKTDSQD